MTTASDGARIAERIAVEARTAPSDGGFVIALCGTWGSGKTSIGNMVAEAIEIDEDSVVVRFNPWMFSGAEDLIGRFFGELAATLGKREAKFRTVAKRVAI